MSKNVVVCLSVGDKYPDEYIYKLRNMVGRNTTVDYDFVCITDRDLDVPAIHISDPHELEPVWYKIRMLAQPELEQYTRKVFFDLDIVIHNNIDWVFTTPVNQLQVIDAAWKPSYMVNSYLDTGCNSSVMLWENSTSIAHIFENNKDAYMCKYAGMDRFLWHEVRDHWTPIPNTEVYSYRHGSNLIDNEPRTMRTSKSICIYHQQPKPHDELAYEPARSFWK